MNDITEQKHSSWRPLELHTATRNEKNENLLVHSLDNPRVLRVGRLFGQQWVVKSDRGAEAGADGRSVLVTVRWVCRTQASTSTENQQKHNNYIFSLKLFVAMTFETLTNGMKYDYCITINVISISSAGWIQKLSGPQLQYSHVCSKITNEFL